MKEGRRLLENRRTALLTLLRLDPSEALEQALTFSELERLPKAWADLVEERFSDVVELWVLPDCTPGAEESAPEIVVRRESRNPLRGVAWGAALGFQSKNRLPVEGIALEGWTALLENGARPLHGEELLAAGRFFSFAPGSRDLPPEQAAIRALIGGEIHRFATMEELESVQALLAEVASLPGPGSADPFVVSLRESGRQSAETILREARTEANSWTETPKTVLVLNAVFPDRTTPTRTRPEWLEVMGEASDWLGQNSYGKTHLLPTVPSQVFTLPLPAAFYQSGDQSWQIMVDARELALAAGYDSTDYDITVVAFPHLSLPWSGKATIGGSGHWLNGTPSKWTIIHEFGHNYGLSHASSWETNDGSVLPTESVPATNDPRHREYGDRFSVMGTAGNGGNFSMHAKASLNWIATNQVQEVTEPGVYRIHRFEHTASSNKPTLALKLQRADSQIFWVGYRRDDFGGNPYLNNGAHVLWEFRPGQCRLLDMTPGSYAGAGPWMDHFSDLEDSALAIGATFADPTGYLYVTPIGQGGASPDEWLDVRVDFTVAGNHPPTAAIQLPPGPIAARTPVTLSAVASDPDGDPLAYLWNFGNGQTATGPTVDWTFLTGGVRNVALRVSDGKGGLAEIMESFTVDDPLAQIEEVGLPGTASLSDAAFFHGLHLGAVSGQGFSAPGDGIWQARSHSLGFSPRRLAVGADRMVGVGSIYNQASSQWRAGIAFTTDGTQWEPRPQPEFPILNSVAWRNGLFAAVGGEGTILTSPDGDTWTSRASPVEETLNDVIATSGGWIACGRAGTILTSPDGITWIRRDTPSTWPQLSRLAADGSRVICIGEWESFWRSEDEGSTWQRHDFNLEGFNPSMIAFGENLWVAAQNSSSYGLRLAVSVNGMDWDLLPSLPFFNITNIRIADGRLWIYGLPGKILRSLPLPAGNRPPALDVAWPPAVAVRAATVFSASASDADGDSVSVMWSPDGQTYFFGSQASHRFLLGGPKTVTAWASDGRGNHVSATRNYQVNDPLLDWADVTPPVLGNFNLQLSAAGPDRVVVAGGNRAIDASVERFADREAWMVRNLPITVRALAWSESGFVAAGDVYDSASASWRGAVIRSADGQSWGSPQILPVSALRDLAVVGDAYVAVGDGGGIFRSVDGETWVPVDSGVTRNLSRVAFAGESGIVLGGGLLLSQDSGLTWEDPGTALQAGFTLTRVFPFSGRLLLAGHNGITVYNPGSGTLQRSVIRGDSDFGTLESLVPHDSLHVAMASRYDSSISRYRNYLLVSEDGLVWESREIFWTEQIRTLVSGGGNLLAAGGSSLLASGLQGEARLVVVPGTLSVAMSDGETGPLGEVEVGSILPRGWTASSNVSWLVPAPSNGTTAATASRVTLLMTESLPVGVHHGTVTFSSAGAVSGSVAVVLTVFEDDHGSTPATASPLSIGQPVDGTVQIAGDRDWFVFDVASPGALAVWTTGDLDTIGELHGLTGFLVRNDDFAGNRNFRIERTVLPGRYWVEVRAFSNGTGSYQLHSSFIPAGPPFALKSWESGEEEGQWRFVVASAAGYRYHVQHSSTLQNDWQQVGSKITAEGEESILTIPAPPPGTGRGFYRIVIEVP